MKPYQQFLSQWKLPKPSPALPTLPQPPKRAPAVPAGILARQTNSVTVGELTF